VKIMRASLGAIALLALAVVATNTRFDGFPPRLGSSPAYAVTPTPTPTATATPTATPTATATPTSTPTATPTATPDYCYIAIRNAYGYFQGEQEQSLPPPPASRIFVLINEPCTNPGGTPAPTSTPTAYASSAPTATPAPTASPTPFPYPVQVSLPAAISALAAVPAGSLASPVPIATAVPGGTRGIELWLGAGNDSSGPDCVTLLYWNVTNLGAVPTTDTLLTGAVSTPICGAYTAATTSGLFTGQPTIRALTLDAQEGWNYYVVGLQASTASGGPRFRFTQ